VKWDLRERDPDAEGHSLASIHENPEGFWPVCECGWWGPPCATLSDRCDALIAGHQRDEANRKRLTRRMAEDPKVAAWHDQVQAAERERVLAAARARLGPLRLFDYDQATVQGSAKKVSGHRLR
jgi:hypothetical protein